MNYTSKQREIILLKTVAVQEDIVKHYKELLAIGTEEPEKPTEAVTEPGILIMDEVFGGVVEDVVEEPVASFKKHPKPRMLGTDRAQQIINLLVSSGKEWTYEALAERFGYSSTYPIQVLHKYKTLGIDYQIRVNGNGKYYLSAARS